MELARGANILTGENKPRKLTGWKVDSREIAGVGRRCNRNNGSYSCTPRYGRSPYKMRQCPEDGKRSEGKVGTMGAVMQTARTFRLTCAPIAYLILWETIRRIKNFSLFLKISFYQTALNSNFRRLFYKSFLDFILFCVFIEETLLTLKRHLVQIRLLNFFFYLFY